MKNSSTLILDWYYSIKRDLPWRKNKDPYSIWLSEIILQQTRIEQGTPYYLSFLKKYPTIQDLALAHEDDVMKLWQGLGYYSRARNLHKTAKIVSYELNGVFPQNSSELKKLPGIGDYTAAAISSISYSEKIPVLDGNVYRILSRIFDIDMEVGNSRSKKHFTETGLKFMGKHEPGDFNQAMMEFGALQCIPVKPNCKNCCLNDYCKSFKTNNISGRPVVKKKKPVKNRYFNYFFIHNGSECYINKRSSKDIWMGLYEFPLTESEKLLSPEETNYKDEIQRIYNFKHLLTHQRLHLQFFVIQSTIPPKLNGNHSLINLSDLKDLPVPKPIESFINSLDISIIHK